LADALNALRRGDVLVVAKRDRLARDTFISVLIEREVAKRGARILSAAGEGTETDDPTAMFTRRILDAVAEFERAITAARTRAALRAKRARGERAGAEPYGFRVNGDGRTLHPDRTEQSVLAMMHAQKAAGQSLRQIASALNAHGHRTRRGTPWRFEYVRSALRTAGRY
jgi:DNA invertase Pin-like site-specific DNA recombinase